VCRGGAECIDRWNICAYKDTESVSLSLCVCVCVFVCVCVCVCLQVFGCMRACLE